jgi:hypothetical protein
MTLPAPKIPALPGVRLDEIENYDIPALPPARPGPRFSSCI